MDQAAEAKKVALLRYQVALANIDNSKIKMKLTSPLADPFTHVELVDTDEDGTTVYQEYHAGDVVTVAPETAEHLFATGQAEPVEG